MGCRTQMCLVGTPSPRFISPRTVGRSCPPYGNFVGSITAPPRTTAPLSASVGFNGARPTFAWLPVPQARYYRVEIADRDGAVTYSAIVRENEQSYRALSGINTVSGNQWRVQALDAALQAVGESAWLAFAVKQQ